MNLPLVSIIIPVYNAEKYITETIMSALAQTWQNKEVIVVNDGSTDGSQAIINSFRASGVIVIDQQNKGASAARNNGLAVAKGDYIQFLDADDLIDQDKITSQLALLQNRKDHLVLGGTVNFYNGDDPYAVKYKFNTHTTLEPLRFLLKLYGKPDAEIGYEQMIQPNAWLTPRQLINIAGVWNEELTLDDDGEFFCRVILASKAVIYTPDTVNYYRKFRNDISLSGRKDKKAMQSMFLSTELKFRHIKARLNDPAMNAALARQFMEIIVLLYPQNKELSRAAEKRVKELGGSFYVPVLGGSAIERIKKTMGWKFARTLQYVLERIKANK
ncbi:MAG: glycosyltransferase family 2 protein [Mucilaginibacter sp.]